MREKIIKYKKLIIVLAIFLGLLVGTTSAYYFSSDTIDNEFTTKEYASRTQETFTSPSNWKPGDKTPKELVVKNHGDLCEDVRVSYTEKWTSENGDDLPLTQNGVSLVNVQLINQDYWVKNGNYYYYNRTLQPGDETNSFIKSVSLNENIVNDYNCQTVGNKVVCDSTGDGYDGATYTLTIDVETMYCETSAEAWGVNVNAIDNNATMFDMGTTVNVKLKELVPGATVIDSETVDSTVTSFVKADSLPSNIVTVSSKDSNYKVVPLANNYNAIDLSVEGSAHPIWAWLQNDVIYWYSDAEIVYLNPNSNAFLRYFEALTSAPGVATLNLEKVRSIRNFFESCPISDLTPISNWNTETVEDFSWIFCICNSLTSTSALAGWDTSSATTMDGVFGGAEALTDLTGLASWDVSNVTTMSQIFYQTSSLTDLDGLQDWDVSSVEDLQRAFCNCALLSDISAIADWNLESNKNLYRTFSNNPALTSVSALSSWDTADVENMQGIFYLTALSSLNGVQSWNTGKVENLQSAFGQITTLTDITALSSWNVTSVKNMVAIFNGDAITSLSALSSWTTTSLETLELAFRDCTGITSLSPLSSWNTSGVTSLASTFRGCTGLTNLTGIGGWTVTSVETMYYIFYGCSNITTLSALSSWTTTSLTNLESAFRGMTSLTNLTGLNNFNVSNVTTMHAAFMDDTGVTTLAALANWAPTSKLNLLTSTFRGMSALTNISGIRNWVVTGVTSMNSMFLGCSKIANLSNLSSWTTTNLTSMDSTFRNMTSLTTIAGISNWNVAKVEWMRHCFRGDSALTTVTGINSWNIKKVKYTGSNTEAANGFYYIFYGVTNKPTFSQRSGSWASNGSYIPNNQVP